MFEKSMKMWASRQKSLPEGEVIRQNQKNSRELATKVEEIRENCIALNTEEIMENCLWFRKYAENKFEKSIKIVRSSLNLCKIDYKNANSPKSVNDIKSSQNWWENIEHWMGLVILRETKATKFVNKLAIL